MSRDQLIGVALLLAGIIGIVAYAWLLFFWNPQIILQITAFVIIGGVLAVLGWIGFTLATTPPPQPIEELTKEEPKAEENRAESTQGKSQ
jgi:predicted DNA-binding transcriptional regulator